MAYPFGGIPLGILRKVMAADFPVEERETSVRVDTLDGPQTQSYWFNESNGLAAEIPGYADDFRLGAPLVGHIARRLGVDHSKLLGACSLAENEAEANA